MHVLAGELACRRRVALVQGTERVEVATAHLEDQLRITRS